MVSLEFFIDIILPPALWPWGLFSLQEIWVPGIFPGSKGGLCLDLTALSPSRLEIWETKFPGTLRACNISVLVLFYLSNLVMSHKYLVYVGPMRNGHGVRWIWSLATVRRLGRVNVILTHILRWMADSAVILRILVYTHPPLLPAGLLTAPHGHTTSYWLCHFPAPTQPGINTPHNPATDILHSPTYEVGTDSEFRNVGN